MCIYLDKISSFISIRLHFQLSFPKTPNEQHCALHPGDHRRLGPPRFGRRDHSLLAIVRAPTNGRRPPDVDHVGHRARTAVTGPTGAEVHRGTAESDRGRRRLGGPPGGTAATPPPPPRSCPPGGAVGRAAPRDGRAGKSSKLNHFLPRRRTRSPVPAVRPLASFSARNRVVFFRVPTVRAVDPPSLSSCVRSVFFFFTFCPSFGRQNRISAKPGTACVARSPRVCSFAFVRAFPSVRVRFVVSANCIAEPLRRCTRCTCTRNAIGFDSPPDPAERRGQYRTPVAVAVTASDRGPNRKTENPGFFCARVQFEGARRRSVMPKKKKISQSGVARLR